MEIDGALQQFLDALKETEAFHNYRYQEERVHRVPGLHEKIDEFRRRNFELQNSNAENLFEKVDEFEREYEDFREDELVREYLAAELAICRMVQKINIAVVRAVNIDVDMPL